MVDQRFDLKHSRGEAVRRHRAWRGFSVEHVIPVRGDSFAYRWQSDLHFCAVHDILLKDGGIQAGKDREDNRKDLRGTLTHIPAEADVEGWSELAERRNSYTAIYFEPGGLHEELDQRFSDDRDVRLYFRDPELAACLHRFSKLLEQAHEADDLFAETLGLMTVLTLQNRKMDEAARKPALSRRASARVVEYVDANLAGHITLENLAAEAGLSRYHFNRAFKADMGESPYQYVLRRRIEAARVLLSERQLALEQVATAVGFRDASYFQKAFKVRTGVNPSEFARKSR
ncbi:MAG: AraC family transcriptional regulator [Roseitalea porphyridii]|uniref:helix-turn-helix transcriptional regulator n=1 Tax=Roseitalea porphyridii TaxID=1852022 RepID=UPI0032EAA054